MNPQCSFCRASIHPIRCEMGDCAFQQDNVNVILVDLIVVCLRQERITITVKNIVISHVRIVDYVMCLMAHVTASILPIVAWTAAFVTKRWKMEIADSNVVMAV